MGSGSRSAFGLYEGIRILIPGFYFAGLLWFLYRSLLAIEHPFWGMEPVGLLVFFLSIIAGFTLYAKEGTKRRKAFRENQPSLFLQRKALTMDASLTLSEDDARRMYFYILNNHIPSIFHEKIFFFGTVYHIMIQIRRTSFWFAILSLAWVGIEISSGRTLQEIQSLVVFTIVVWLIYLLNVRYNKADRKMQENYRDQIYWLQMNNKLVERVIRSHVQITSIQNRS